MSIQTVTVVSRTLNISTRMLRYYEKIGLISPVCKGNMPIVVTTNLPYGAYNRYSCFGNCGFHSNKSPKYLLMRIYSRRMSVCRNG